ncbi:hypothetical protein AX17_005670 [Amanita inopinata Kibby_2008]|nr:hypothetical protein AX17_005670 [Amanita inopinata Kibby_2008]
MRLTAVVISAFLLVGNVVAASSNYGDYSFVARDYDLDARDFAGGSGRKMLDGRHEFWRRSGGDCSETYGAPIRNVSAKKCEEMGGVGWKRGTTGITCYQPSEAPKSAGEGRCYPGRSTVGLLRPDKRLPPTPKAPSHW